MCATKSHYCLVESNNPGFLEGGKSTVFLDGFQPFHREVDDDGLAELRDINAPFLEIRLTTDLSRRVKLGRADAI